jgi:CHAT domain-containing protein
MSRRSPAEAEAAYRRGGEALRRAVWDPLAPHLKGAEGVFLVPAGTLHMVAFAALPVGEDRYLFEEGPMLHHLSAERDLVALRDRAAWSGGLLAMGGAAFDEPSLFAALERRPKKAGGEAPVQLASMGVFRGTRSECGEFRDLKFDPLPGSRREAREVTGLWRQARRAGDGSGLGEAVRLEGAAASEAAFKANAEGRRVLHLATHGFFLGGRCPVAGAPSTRGFSLPPKPEKREQATATGENPLLLSGLALAGANHREAAGEGEEDGVLTAEEIAALDLSGVEWAVLSGCGTGLGRVQDGEGVLGLRRAFQVAGANTLILSLWEVDDRSTREWMRVLYQARFLDGLTTAESVRRASSEVLGARRERGESTHPFFWAGFVAAGGWR